MTMNMEKEPKESITLEKGLQPQLQPVRRHIQANIVVVLFVEVAVVLEIVDRASIAVPWQSWGAVPSLTRGFANEPAFGLPINRNFG